MFVMALSVSEYISPEAVRVAPVTNNLHYQNAGLANLQGRLTSLEWTP